MALIAGGHTFGKAHGAADPNKYIGPAPEAAPLEEQGLGWRNSFRAGKGPDTIGAGPEGAWTNRPTAWDHGYFQILFKYDWEKTKSPAGAYQWTPKEQAVDILVPDAHDSAKTHAPMMFTTDMSLKMDPTYLVRGSLVSMFFEQFKLVLSNFMTTKRHTHNGSKNTHHHY